MGFLSGLVTGAATSIDNQLKADMKRTEERAEGMAQYRVTRRRAALEEQEKEKKEIRDVMNNLASLFDGDVDKAAQLYVKGGQNVAGATKLYEELYKNKAADKDISTAITFAEARAEPGKMTDYISKFITPISSLPVTEGEVKGSGLYGALFKPNLSKSVMRQVDEAAPLPAAPTSRIDVKGAKIDRSGFLAAEEAAYLATSREREEVKFKQETTAFEGNQKRLKQVMEIAEANEKRAKNGELNAEEEKAYNRGRQEIQDLQTQARLIQDAEAHVLNMRKSSLDIERTEAELAKQDEHPVFSSYEDMAVYATQKLAEGDFSGAYTEDDYKRLRDDAFEGAKKYANSVEVDDPTAGAIEFSKQSLDSIIDSSIERQLKPLGLVAGVNQKVEDLIKGNEAKYFDNMNIAINNVIRRLTPENGTLKGQAARAIKAEQDALSEKIQTYGASVKDTFDNKPIESKPDNYKDLGALNNIVKDFAKSQNVALNANNINQITREAAKANLRPGSVVETRTGYRIWTGTRFVE